METQQQQKVLDIEGYLRRIRMLDNETPFRKEDFPTNFETLARLQKAHSFAVPFENLDVHRKKKILVIANDKDHNYPDVPPNLRVVARFYDKIVNHNRGGFCFEQNSLFKWALETLGFNVQKELGAAMVWNYEERQFMNRKTHCLVVVKLPAREKLHQADAQLPTEETWICDVGYGDGPIDPMLLETGLAQMLSDGNMFRYIKDNEFTVLQKLDIKTKEWTNRIRWSTYQTIDAFDSACTFVQTDPASIFVQKIVVTIRNEDERFTLAGLKFIRSATMGPQRDIKDLTEEEFFAILKDTFGIVLDDEGGQYVLDLKASKEAPASVWVR